MVLVLRRKASVRPSYNLMNVKLGGGEGDAHLVSIPGAVELVRRRVFRLQSLRLDISKRRHCMRPFTLSDGDHSSTQASSSR